MRRQAAQPKEGEGDDSPERVEVVRHDPRAEEARDGYVEADDAGHLRPQEIDAGFLADDHALSLGKEQRCGCVGHASSLAERRVRSSSSTLLWLIGAV